jgi:hypothetical protein
MPATAGQKTNIASVLSLLVTIRASINASDDDQRALAAVCKRIEREIVMARGILKGGV